MAAAEAKAVSNIRQFVEFAFFWPKSQHDCWRVASPNVLTLFLGGGAGCGDTIGGGDPIGGSNSICGGNAGWDGSACGDGEVVAGVMETPVLAGLVALSSPVEGV